MADGASRRPNPGAAPGRANWRDRQAASKPQSKSRNDHWLRRRATDFGKIRFRFKLAVVTLLALALVAAVLYQILRKPQNPTLIAVAILDYDQPIPPNAWAWEDVQSLSALAGGNRTAGNVVRPADSDLMLTSGSPWRSKDSFLGAFQERLGELDRIGGPERTQVLIVYLSGHGVLNEAGAPCLLLPPESRFDKLERLWDMNLLPLAEVVKALEQESLRGVKKVVVLDCQKMESNWQLGILHNEFAAGLKRFVEQQPDNDLWFLCSAGEGQVSWALPDRGESLFAHFFRLGLAGRADLEEMGGNGDDVVSLLELEGYLERTVSAAAADQCGESQTPRVLPALKKEEAEVPLAYVQKNLPIEDMAEAKAGFAGIDYQGRHNEFLKLWQEVEKRELELQRQASGGGAKNRPPQRQRDEELILCEALRQGLLHWEQYATAGEQYAAKADSLHGQLADWGTKLRGGEEDWPSNFALRQQQAWMSDEQVRQAVRGLLALDQDAKAAEFAKSLSLVQRREVVWRWVTAQAPIAGPASTPTPANTLKMLGAWGDEIGEGCEPPELRMLRMLRPGGLAPVAAWGEGGVAVEALWTRGGAEGTAFCFGDPRLHYPVRRKLDGLDQERRLAEDGVFLESPSLVEGFSGISERYAVVEGENRRMARAYAARQWGWLDAPHLVRLAMRQAARGGAGEGEPESYRNCQALLQALVNLQGSIERANDAAWSPGAVADLKQVDTLADEVVSRLERLRAQLAVEANTVGANPERNARNWRFAHDLLSGPLLPAARRQALRDLVDRGHGNLEERPAGQEHLPSPLRPAPESLVQLLLGMESAAGGARAASGSTDPSGQKIRVTLATRFGGRFGMAPTGTDREHRSELADQGQNVLRSMSMIPLGAEAAILLGAPAIALEKFDRQQFLVWHARRALGDFWGGDGDPAGGENYFVALSRSLLGAAGKSGPRSVALEQAQTAANRLTDVAKTLISVEAESAASLPGDAEALSVTVKLGIGSGATEGVGQDSGPGGLLPGQAVLLATERDDLDKGMAFREGSGGELRNRMGAAVPERGQTLNLAFPLPGGVGSADSLSGRLTVYYRGHIHREATFGAARLAPFRQLVTEWPEEKSASIHVATGVSEPGSIAFVLDCSDSMKEREEGEQSRMGVAKTALLRVLAELANAKPSYKVTLWLYGHRRGWDGKREWSRVEQAPGLNPNDVPTWFAAHREGLPPSQDVEMAWPAVPGRNFDGRGLTEVRGLLGNVDHFGYTPLYLSIQEALRRDPLLKAPGGIKRLVVLTDGDDQVWDRTGPERRSANVDGLVEALADARKRSGGRFDLHVVAIGSARKRDGELKRLLASAGVDPNQQFYDLSNAGSGSSRLSVDKLEQTLLRAFGLRRYELVSSKDGSRFARELLNTTTEFPAGAFGGYTVSILGLDAARGRRDFVVRGGEALRMTLSSPATESPILEFDRYNPRDAETVRLSAERQGSGGGIEQVDCWVSRPERLGDGTLAFSVAMQNHDRTRFTPRPSEMWLAARPLRSGDSREVAPTYHVYDARYESGQPVPVLRFRLPDWPADATRVELSLFLRFGGTTDELGRITLADIKASPVGPSTDGRQPFRLTLRNDANRVTVTQEYAGPPGSEPVDFDQIKLDVDLAGALSTPPSAARRRYLKSKNDVGTQRAEHEFTFARDEAGQMLRRQLLLTERSKIQQQANFRVQGTIEVRAK